MSAVVTGRKILMEVYNRKNCGKYFNKVPETTREVKSFYDHEIFFL